MCGILGGIGEKSDQFVLDNIGNLTRRGPDSSNYVVLENGLSLGATRLAMTDPHQRSNQPMIDLLTKNVLVFNGEIYNYKLLKEKLIARNIEFYTESDTEVLSKFLTEFGIDGIRELEGMYAFAFYNHKNNSLIIARDFLGKKPLYYTMTNGVFIFSSQASLLKNYCHNLSLNPNAFNEYLRIGYVQDPHTIFKNISAVSPGEVFELNLTNLRISERKIVSPKSLNKESDFNFSHLLNNAILERTTGHSHFALSMSGGMDSSLIAMQSKKLGLSLTAYTMKFSDSDKKRYNNDALAAQKICKILGIKNLVVEMPNSTEIPRIMANFISAMDEPNINPTGLAQMILFSRIADDGNRLLLTGDGADEVFGGYLRYSQIAKLELVPQIKSEILEKIITSGKLDNSVLRKIAYSFVPSKSMSNWLYWHLVSSGERIKRLTGFNYELNLNQEVIANLRQKRTRNRISELMLKDLAIFITMESNRRLDRISMWNSIEARSPFQSEKIISYGSFYMNKTKFSKMNKNLFYEEFPDLKKLPILKEKTGFISPLGHWLRSNKVWVAESIDQLNGLNMFNSKELNQLREAPYRNDWESIRLLWSMIVFSQWSREFLKK
jgi:asparagine synthase (glutamine-hydrolysing)